MRVFLVHHADAVGPDVDAQRPLSGLGRAQAERLAERAKASGCVPAAIWHSGKLRARQTADPFYRLCSPFAEFKMMRGLGPEDSHEYMRDLLTHETRDLLIVGHMPNLRDLLFALVNDREFPLHGLVALETHDGGASWTVTDQLET